MGKRRMYFNRAQLEAMIVGARREYIVAGRGTGKSEGFDARALVRNAFAMPGSSGALLSPSIAKLRRQTFPAIAHALARWGYREGLHYVVGRAPARNLGFGRPLTTPFDWANVIAFYNGSIVHMVSFDRAMSTNSMSLDYVIGPEARFLDYAKITGEVLPAIRGNGAHFGQCPWHGGVCFSTDMPQGSRGAWILEKERDMDPELIRLIKMLYLQRQAVLQRGSGRAAREAEALQRDMNALRARATFFARYSSLENLAVLGEAWFAEQQRNLPPRVFATSILSERVHQEGNAFYAELDEMRHTYTDRSLALADLGGIHATDGGSAWDGDVQPDRPLMIANDYNAAINTLVVGQTDGRTLRTLNAMWVKSPQRLEDVVRQFCHYYRAQRCRDVIFYYDHTAVARSAASGYSFADVVLEALRQGGFNPVPAYIGRTVMQSLRYEYANAALRGNARWLFPLFHATRCKDLITAMQRARVAITNRGWGKDKREEKLADSPELPDEIKTHITDAWDTLFIGANLHPHDREGGLAEFI